MDERCFGSVWFIPGENQGKYPFCHSLYIEDAGVLIDPASDRNRLKRLREESSVKAIRLSHWHEDHFMQKHLDVLIANSTVSMEDGRYHRRAE
jgi:glyoxylase-like metal-dependent hydrolase (beta-lactamase superfamily II)